MCKFHSKTKPKFIGSDPALSSGKVKTEEPVFGNGGVDLIAPEENRLNSAPGEQSLLEEARDSLGGGSTEKQERGHGSSERASPFHVSPTPVGSSPHTESQSTKSTSGTKILDLFHNIFAGSEPKSSKQVNSDLDLGTRSRKYHPSSLLRDDREGGEVDQETGLHSSKPLNTKKHSDEQLLVSAPTVNKKSEPPDSSQTLSELPNPPSLTSEPPKSPTLSELPNPPSLISEPPKSPSLISEPPKLPAASEPASATQEVVKTYKAKTAAFVSSRNSNHNRPGEKNDHSDHKVEPNTPKILPSSGANASDDPLSSTVTQKSDSDQVTTGHKEERHSTIVNSSKKFEGWTPSSDTIGQTSHQIETSQHGQSDDSLKLDVTSNPFSYNSISISRNKKGGEGEISDDAIVLPDGEQEMRLVDMGGAEAKLESERDSSGSTEKQEKDQLRKGEVWVEVQITYFVFSKKREDRLRKQEETGDKRLPNSALVRNVFSYPPATQTLSTTIQSILEQGKAAFSEERTNEINAGKGEDDTKKYTLETFHKNSITVTSWDGRAVADFGTIPQNQWDRSLSDVFAELKSGKVLKAAKNKDKRFVFHATADRESIIHVGKGKKAKKGKKKKGKK